MGYLIWKKLQTSRIITLAGMTLKYMAYYQYSLVPNCRGRGSNCKFWEKNPQVHLIIIKE